MDFTFQCEGNNGATMSSYCYFREPSVQDSGYTRGLKAGSFNYLENGTIDIKEVVRYEYENGTALDNSTYSHQMNVDFTGEKSISEFYAKEYFKNNKAIAAWKKIKYEDIKPKWKLGQSNMAKEIHVASALFMDTTPGEDGNGYSLDYNAKIKGGVIETRDAIGWSNRTGARRTIWEHNAVMRGDVNVTNILKESAPLVVHAGVEDWLPCCYKGTLPPNERIYTDWPSQSVINTLEADTISPQKNCQQKCYQNGTCKKECTDMTCTPQNCSGYECVETVDQIGLVGISSLMLNAFLTNESSTSGLYIENTYKKVEATKQVIYEVRIKNMGDIKVRSLEVVDTLPSNMKLTDSKYKDEEDGILEEPIELPNQDGTTTLTWSIGDLDSGKWKTIQMTVYAGEGTYPTSNKVVATGMALGIAVEATSNKAEPQMDTRPEVEGEDG